MSGKSFFVLDRRTDDSAIAINPIILAAGKGGET